MLAAAASGELPGVFGTLEPILADWGYLAVAGFIFLEDFGIPLPGETILITAAVMAGAGKLNVVVLGLVAVCAAILGDNVGFAIGHFGGRPLVLRWGKYVFITGERLDKVEGFFRRHGGKVVTVARFIEGLRQANGIVAGISRMHWLKFLAFNALGALLWCGVWIAVGDAAGSNIDTLYAEFRRYQLYLLIAIGVAIVALIGYRLLRRRNNA